MAGHVATSTSTALTATILKIRQSMPDLVAPNPVNERRHSKETEMVHLVWTEYLIGLARFMAPPIILPIIPTETDGSLNRPPSSTLNTRGKGRPARTTMKSLAHQT